MGLGNKGQNNRICIVEKYFFSKHLFIKSIKQSALNKTVEQVQLTL